jgi:phage-related protein
MQLQVVFYRTLPGKEPVREWLKALSVDDRKTIGEDIKTVQFGWPLGMPIVRKIEPGLWEVRSSIKNGVARVIFTIEDNYMVLLHSFIKKSQKMPLDDLKLAKERLAKLRGET